MNNKVVISADCTCDLPESMVKEYSIQIIPFYVVMDGVRFRDGEEIDILSVYEKIEKEDGEVVSEVPSIEDYKEYFQKVAANQGKAIIHICVSQKVSSAYKNAVAAAQEMKNVYVVDSGLNSHGMGLFVLEAVRLVRWGASPEKVLEGLKGMKNRISCSFVLKSTQYISTKNRLNQMLSNMLEIFRIKPVIRIQKNELRVTGICLGNNKSCVKKYLRKILRNKESILDEILFIAVVERSEEFREFVYREATATIKWKQVYMQDVSATNLCNVGPGGVGVMFYTK